MFNKILVGLNNSPNDDNVTETAIYLAQNTGCKIDALVLDENQTGLERFLTRCKKAKIPANIVSFEPVDVEEFAYLCSADLIVAAKNDMIKQTSSKKMVIEQLLQMTPVPVLAVPDNFAVPENLLFGFDGSVTAERAVRTFLFLFHKLTLDYYSLTVSDAPDQCEGHLERISEFFNSHDIEADLLAMPGEPSEVIVNIAQKLPSVWIVVGAGKETFKEILQNSSSAIFTCN